jgi:hypothetical protein
MPRTILFDALMVQESTKAAFKKLKEQEGLTNTELLEKMMKVYKNKA